MNNESVNQYDYLGLITCYKWMLITLFDDKIGNHDNNLTSDDCATSNCRYSPNGTTKPDFDASKSPNQPYENGQKFRVNRQNGKKDNRTVNDSGAGFAYPRGGLPKGVDPDEWLDLWVPPGKDHKDPEWNVVEQDIVDCEECPEGWSKDNPPPEPENKKKFDKAKEEKAKEDERKADERWRKRNQKK